MSTDYIDIMFGCWEDGKYAYAKGHVDLQKFSDAIRNQIDKNDSLADVEPQHTWMRCVRDFQEDMTVWAEATPNSRGAFPVTWVQEW